MMRANWGFDDISNFTPDHDGRPYMHSTGQSIEDLRLKQPLCVLHIPPRHTLSFQSLARVRDLEAGVLPHKGESEMFLRIKYH